MAESCSTRPQETDSFNTSPPHLPASTNTNACRNIEIIPKYPAKDNHSKLIRSDGGCSPNPPHKRRRPEHQPVGEDSELRSPNRKRQVLDSYPDTRPDGSISYPFSVSDDNNHESDKTSSLSSSFLSGSTVLDSDEFCRKIDDQFPGESAKVQFRAGPPSTELRPDTRIANSTVGNSQTCDQHPGFSCTAGGAAVDNEVTRRRKHKQVENNCNSSSSS